MILEGQTSLAGDGFDAFYRNLGRLSVIAVFELSIIEWKPPLVTVRLKRQ